MKYGRLGGSGSPVTRNPLHAVSRKPESVACIDVSGPEPVAEDPSSGMWQDVNRVRP